MGRTDTVIDVQAIGRGPDHTDLCTQLGKQQRCDLVSRPVGAIKHDLHAAQVKPARHAGLAELDITADRLHRAPRLAQPVRIHGQQRLVDGRLDGRLGGVIKLFAQGGKELDAIVKIRVVRGTDHHPGIGAQGTGQKRNGRRRHRPEQLHIGAGGHQSRLQCRFEHVTGNPGVLADHHHRPPAALGREHPPQGIAQAQHEFCGDHAVANPATDAIGTKIATFRHQATSWSAWAG